MWDLHGGHCKIDKYVQMNGFKSIMDRIELFISPITGEGMERT